MEDFSPGIEFAFPHDFQECDCTVETQGDPVPDFVRGTYYLNGPARFGFGRIAFQHWLDGDGMVSSLRFGRDSVHLKSRYIRSRKFEEEQRAGRPLFRTFGTAFEGSRLNSIHNGLESPVNVSVYPFRERLLAFGEQGLPWELDSETLETRGQMTFGGRLNAASPFAAHPKFDPETGEMFNFGVFFAAEALVECAERDACSGGHVALPHVLEAALFGEGHGNIEDLVPASLHGTLVKRVSR